MNAQGNDQRAAFNLLRGNARHLVSEIRVGLVGRDPAAGHQALAVDKNLKCVGKMLFFQRQGKRCLIRGHLHPNPVPENRGTIIREILEQVSVRIDKHPG
jgi:hypothetical protein